MQTDPNFLRAWATVALVYCAAIWGSTFFVVKDVVADLDPLLLVGYRFTLAAILLLPFVVTPILRKASGSSTNRLNPRAWQAGLALGAVLWLLYAAQTVGLKYTSAANSGFITGLFIVFIPFLGWLILGAKPSVWQVIAVGVATAGLALLTGGLSELNAGDALTLAAAFTYAWHVLLTDQFARRGYDPYVLCFVQLLLTGLLSLAVAHILGIPMVLPGSGTLRQVVFLTLFPTLSAFMLQLWAQRHVNPVRVALIFTLEPVFGALFAWTLGGEEFVALRAAGGLVIVVATLLAELPGPGAPAADRAA